MEKSENSKRKDALRELRRHGRVFVRVPQTIDMRTTGSGVTFGGIYIKPERSGKNRESARQYQASKIRQS